MRMMLRFYGSGLKVEPSNQGWFAEENLGILEWQS